MKNTTTALVLCSFLSACAAPPMIERGVPVTLVQEPPRQGSFSVDISNEGIVQGAGGGMGLGAAGGALWGLTCGPWAPVCVLGGAIIVGLGGAVVGAGVGVATGLPAETQKHLQDRIDGFVAVHDPQQHLMNEIAQRASGHWMIVPRSPSSTAVFVRVERVTILTMASRGRLRLQATVTTQGPGQERDRAEKTVEYLGPPADVAVWIDNPNDFVAASFRDGYAFIAQSIVGTLSR